ncbi:transcription elongation factor GreAB [Deinococcus sp. SDU3-2]|uniref:Transcription elongation factor GreAB n=1 Tax=Deinococcus terrestris TaxID=2651870 RepID=A0A7X1NWG3_9DEIO|nr:GreA/GreB family elongation factor [Deinococcus terrestris]MPY66933.1 transcription elongation factor GreAB [Deinococcus terrestris]
MAEEVQMTAEGYQRLQDTLDKERQRRDDAIAQIAAARDDAMDLEDRNLETSQIDLPSMEARILELEDVLARAVIVETPESDGTVGLGSVVVLRDDEHDRELEVRLVSAVEVDALAAGATQVSEDSPVGQALMGRRVGESFEVTQGERQLRYTVKSVG